MRLASGTRSTRTSRAPYITVAFMTTILLLYWTARRGLYTPLPKLPTDHLEEVLGVARALDLDLRDGPIDLDEVVWRELNPRSAEILLEPSPLRRPWNRNDPRALGQQPGECDLGGRRRLARRERLQPFDEREIRLPVLLGEPRHDVPEVRGHEGRLLVDRAGEEPLAE